MRRLICILLMLCLPLQGFAMHGGALLFGSDEGIAHQVAHIEHIEHHHHDADGSVHYDDSEESAQHTQDHSCSPQFAFLAIPYQALAPEPATGAVDATVTGFIPDPFLDSPLRPPALTLG